MIKVAQCWDDGVLNDIKVAELCRKYEAKATFNLNPGFHWAKKRITDQGHCYLGKYYSGKLAWDEVTSVYEGFEVASHGMCHLPADRIDAKVIAADAVSARNIIEDKFQKECRGFAWPCSCNTPETCDLLRENGFAYARLVGSTPDVTGYTDPMLLTPTCHFQDSEFYRKYEEAKKTGVFYFWGHTYEMMDSPGLWDQVEQKLAFISADPESEWADVIDIIK